MSVPPRSESSTRLNSLATLNTSHAAKASAVGSASSTKLKAYGRKQDYRSKRAEASPQTSRSAPGERSRYQLWPALEPIVRKPLPGALAPAVVGTLDRKRSVRVQQSAEQMWRVYGQGEDRRPPESNSKPTPASPKITRQPMLDVANINTSTRINRRSNSAPGRTYQNESWKPQEDVSAKYTETTSPPQQDLQDKDLTRGERTKSLKRASSVLLPAELADLVFPRLQRRAFDADGRKVQVSGERPHAYASREESGDENPPAVPPKTPPKQRAQNLHVSPLKLRPTKGLVYDKALPQIGGAGTSPWPMVGSPTGQVESKHVRDGSGDSVMERGRPSKRSRSQVKRGIMGSRNGLSVDLTSEILPKGWDAHSVSANFPGEEIRKLDHQARSQIGRFEVLHLKDVKALSQQVRLLDEQCEYLRGFAKSLRRNRRTLHAQTIAYLKSPVLSEIPRQSMLQKVETLADLDDTIDEWAKKLERAEDQRLRARQRLLEHIAAVLAMPPVTDSAGTSSRGSTVGRELSPPQSPESLKSPPVTSTYDAESIRIYAGSEMHALLGALGMETAAFKGGENMI